MELCRLLSGAVVVIGHVRTRLARFSAVSFNMACSGSTMFLENDGDAL
jgi:hypothetical protein